MKNGLADKNACFADDNSNDNSKNRLTTYIYPAPINSRSCNELTDLRNFEQKIEMNEINIQRIGSQVRQ